MSAFEQFTRDVRDLQPDLGIVLGSGLSSALNELRIQSSIAFADVPGLSVPSVAGHSGRVVMGTFGSKPVLVFQGRLHFYEGHSSEVVTALIRLTASLGAKKLLLTNAAGGIHPSLHPGMLMIVRDHLFLQGSESRRGPGPKNMGCFAGERPSAYSHRLIDALRESGRTLGEHLLTGIYAAVTGPSYETPAEIRALRNIGADAVGMSTAREIETGATLGLECAALSCITNRAAGLSEGPLDHKDVIEIAARSRDRLGRLIEEFIKRIS